MNILRFIKTAQRVVKQSAHLLAALVLIAAPAAQAATRIKQDNTTALNLAGSWDTLPGAADIAQWTSTVTAGNTTASLGADLSWAGISIVSPGGLVTINAGNTLTIGTSGIDLSTATQDLTLNCGLTLRGGKQSWKVNSGRTLNVAGTFTHTGALVDFTSFGSGALIGIANDASGILGPWAITGSGTSMNYVTNNAGAITAYTGQTVGTPADLSNVLDKDVNYSLTPPSSTVSSTLTGPITGNTLRVTSSMTVDTYPAIANAGNSITLNGLIGVGTGRTRISGTGSLVIGATKELVVNWTIAFSAILCPVVDYNDGTTTYPSSVSISVASTVAEWSFGASGVNATYSGGTTLNLPTVNSSMCNFYGTSFGTGPITVNGPGMIKNLGTLTNSLTLNGGAGLRNGGTYSGPVTVNGASYFSLNNYNMTISGNISGPGGWNVAGSAVGNTITLSGNNTFTGPITVTTGTLKAGTNWVANLYGAFGLNAAVTMGTANAVMNLNGFDTQIGSLTGGGPLGGIVTNSHATTAVTLTVGGDNTSPAAFAGRILGPRLSLRKIGSGTLILSGTNTYSGSTTVSEGTLGGTGTIAGNVTFEAGSKALFTNGVPLTVLGSLVLSDNVVVHLNLPVDLAFGTYTLATYNPTDSSGAFASVPVIDSGSIKGSAKIITSGGTVKLNVSPPGMVILFR